MSLEILNTPPKVFLTGNLAPFKFRYNVFDEGWSVKPAEITLYFNFPFSINGDPITTPAFGLTFDGVTQNFYLRHNPDWKGNQIPYASDYNNDPSLYMYPCNNQIGSNKILLSYYNIVYSVSSIILIAREKGSRFNLAFVPGCLTNVTFVITPSIDQANPVGRASFHILREGLKQIEFDKSFILESDNVHGIVESNIAVYCKKDTIGHFSYPEIEPQYKVHDILTEIQVLIGIKKGNPEVETRYYISETLYALDGQFSAMKMALLNNEGKNFIQYLGTGASRKFLTDAPNPKPTDIYAPEKLYYLTPAAGNYRIYCKKYFKCIEKTTYSEDIALGENVIFEILASYKKISTSEYFKIYSYEIWLQDDAGNMMSEKFKFNVDRNYYAYARYFLFLNRYCVYDCFRTTGMVKKTTDINKSFINISDPEVMTSLSRRSIQTNVDQLITYELNTGNAPRAMNEWATEFFSSKDVLLLKNTLALPVVVKEAKNSSDINSNVPESRKAILEQLYYEDISHEVTVDSPMLPDFNDDYNKDFNTYSFKDSGDFVPVAYAGEDVDLGNNLSGTLDASYIDDELTGTWSKISGPGVPTFSDIHDPKTTVRFSKAGTYILRWTVTFGRCSEFDDMVAIASVEGPYAGVDFSFEASILQHALAGTSEMACIWTKISGPGTATFTDNTSPTTNVTLSDEGTYVLRLASSETPTIYDEVVITANFVYSTEAFYDLRTNFNNFFNIYNPSNIPLGSNPNIHSTGGTTDIYFNTSAIDKKIGIISKATFLPGFYRITLIHYMNTYPPQNAYVVGLLSGQRIDWYGGIERGGHLYPRFGTPAEQRVTSGGTVNIEEAGKLIICVPGEYSGQNNINLLPIYSIEIKKLL